MVWCVRCPSGVCQVFKKHQTLLCFQSIRCLSGVQWNLVKFTKKSAKPLLRSGWRQGAVQFSANSWTCVWWSTNSWTYVQRLYIFVQLGQNPICLPQSKHIQKKGNNGERRFCQNISNNNGDKQKPKPKLIQSQNVNKPILKYYILTLNFKLINECSL